MNLHYIHASNTNWYFLAFPVKNGVNEHALKLIQAVVFATSRLK